MSDDMTLANTQGLGRHRQTPPERLRSPSHRRSWARLAATIVTIGIALAIAVTFAVSIGERPSQAGPFSLQNGRIALPTSTGSYIGVYLGEMPSSYSKVASFTETTGVKPTVILYYSSWLEPFQAEFTISAAKHGAVPLVQINPFGVNLAAVADGKYDSYLATYAKAVRSYGHPVILSFGHEMNGSWYPWGFKHTSPIVFVAAWRHMVTFFRKAGARNVTWMWTVNVIHTNRGIPSPGPWWPGSSYVNWVGMDGYYYSPSWKFATLFGPTIAAVRELTRDPILISETAASPATNQAAKIADLFAGIKLYGLLGFVWFDANRVEDWRLDSPAAISAFRRNAEMYRMPAS